MAALCLCTVVVVGLSSLVGGVELDLTALSESLADLANRKLGVEAVQEHYDNLDYTTGTRDGRAITDELESQLKSLFDTQKDALKRLRFAIEAAYEDRNTRNRDPRNYCCNLRNLTVNDYEFGQPVSRDRSCDRVSGIADNSAPSLFGQLDGVYKENERAPLKWQYFGSELGVLNQFPAGKAPDCDTYDHRFRPWYIASATPNPKDVVLIVKNKYLCDSGKTVLFDAVDILLRTLNPRDRVAIVLFNREIYKPALSGCYATNLSLATPANVRKFQNFLLTAPGPTGGYDLKKALEAAFPYFETSYSTSAMRDRVIALFTDGERIEDGEKEIRQLVSNRTSGPPKISLFIFAANPTECSVTPGVRLYLQSLIDAASGGNQQYVELPSTSSEDVRRKMASFYSTFAGQGVQSTEFTPLFLVPYYDLFGLDQLVITLSTPCFSVDPVTGNKNLVGVAAVDITLADLLAGVEYFKEGDLSYAFVVDKDGLVLFHPLLPFPSSNNSAVYLDISTLEPHTGFQEVRDAMINGNTGCKDLNVTQALSLGTTPSEGGRSIITLSRYCWKQVSGTPFSVVVVIPADSEFSQLSNSLTTHTDAHYHRLDILGHEHQCRHLTYRATKDHATVVFTPEAFARPEQYILYDETETDVLYIQNAITTLTDEKQIFRRGILYSVAATGLVDDIWLAEDVDETEHMRWRYITTSDGVFRIFPGIQFVRKDLNSHQRLWYQRAVAHLGLLTIIPPYDDGLGAGTVMTLSRAIIPKACDSVRGLSDPSCSVLAVMGMDFTHYYFSQLLYDTVPLCSHEDDFRCLLIDSSGYILSHPDFASAPNNVIQKHVAEMEPLLAEDMVDTGYLQRVYCHNFQYNADFTKRPRRQYLYEVTDKVAKATEPLYGGYSTYCTFYKIAPVNGTNTYLIMIDLQRSAHTLCSTISCPCIADQPCSSLPSDCECPCTEDILPSNYNPCLETFEDLVAPACPSHSGLESVYRSTDAPSDTLSLPLCYIPNCQLRSTKLACESVHGCEFCVFNLSNNTTVMQCRHKGQCPEPSEPTDFSTEATRSDNDAEIWQTVSVVLICALVILSVLILGMLLWFIVQRHRSKANGRKISLTTSSEHSITERRALHALNATVELSSMSSTSTSKESSQTKKDQDATAVEDSQGQLTAQEQADEIPESLQIRGGFAEHDVFRNEQGSLNPSHAGGIWF